MIRKIEVLGKSKRWEVSKYSLQRGLPRSGFVHQIYITVYCQRRLFGWFKKHGIRVANKYQKTSIILLDFLSTKPSS
jgi:hypothetical protein